MLAMNHLYPVHLHPHPHLLYRLHLLLQQELTSLRVQAPEALITLTAVPLRFLNWKEEELVVLVMLNQKVICRHI